MIHDVRLPNGHKRPQLSGEIACPWNMHYHSGDEIEVELEMIICKHKTEEFMKEIFGG